MVQLLEILKVEFLFREVCYDVFKTPGRELEPDNTQGNVVFAPGTIQVVKRDSLAYIPVALRQQRAGVFLFRPGPGEDALDMAVHLLKPVDTASEYASQLFVIAADEEELPVLDDMGKVIVGSVAHIGKIYGGGDRFSRQHRPSRRKRHIRSSSCQAGPRGR